MKSNHRRDKKDKDGKKFDIEQWEEKAKTMKTQRRERHKSKNQRPHHLARTEDDDMD
ncbi:hypothetical protein BH09BAC1_BH09BAC1_14180 [soil metagenome]